MSYQDEVIAELRRIAGELNALKADIAANLPPSKMGDPTTGAIEFAIMQIQDGIKHTHYFPQELRNENK